LNVIVNLKDLLSGGPGSTVEGAADPGADPGRVGV